MPSGRGSPDQTKGIEAESRLVEKLKDLVAVARQALISAGETLLFFRQIVETLNLGT